MQKNKKGSSVFYHFAEGIRASWRNRLVNVGAVGLLIACLLFTGIFTLLIYNLNAMTEELGAQNQIRVFLADSADAETVAAIGEKISTLQDVTGVVYISKEEALESLRGEYGDLLDGLEEDNPLRNGYTVTLSDQRNMESVVAYIQTIPNVEKLSYEGAIAEKFVEIRNFILWGGMTLCGVFAIISVVVVANAVRISVFTRHREIKIMKIIGATNRFVRAPFMFEGQLLGILGACIAYLLVWLFYEQLFVPGVSQLGFVTPVAFSDFGLYLGVIYLVAGIFMGMFGSLIVINRYLKH